MGKFVFKPPSCPHLQKVQCLHRFARVKGLTWAFSWSAGKRRPQTHIYIKMVPLSHKATALLALTREKPVSWARGMLLARQVSFPRIGKAGHFFCHLPHYNPDLSKVVWKAKFSHCNEYLPLIFTQDDKVLFHVRVLNEAGNRARLPTRQDHV